MKFIKHKGVISNMTEKIKPTKRQLEYQEWEFGLFIHFGLRTFYEGHVDFDGKEMHPESFHPENLDCEQWIKTAKEAGMEYAVLTAKHHDGFSNWPSKYTNFSVAQSKWQDGKGDVVKEFIDACRKYDVKPGLYYSPYDGAVDFYEDEDPKKYDDYFVNQITELLTNYGDIDILWFDGAGSEGHEYDWPRIIKVIRNLQPNILIFNMADPDFRWIGNEDGLAPTPTWNVVDNVNFSIYDDELEKLNEHVWLPAECDVQMRYNWFFSEHDEHHVKSLEELIGLYYHSIGRGTNLLLNIGPNREGLLPEKDRVRLLEMGANIKRRFQEPIARFADFTHEEGKWSCRMDEPRLIDHLIIQEDLTDGESVKEYKIDIQTAHSWSSVTVHRGLNIGNKAIIRIPPVKVRAVTLEVMESDGEAMIKDISVHHVGKEF